MGMTRTRLHAKCSAVCAPVFIRSVRTVGLSRDVDAYMTQAIRLYEYCALKACKEYGGN
jgi:hypothetical protein